MTLTPDALQALMQHRDYQTTQRYINMARQLNPAVQNLYVPTLPLTVAREVRGHSPSPDLLVFGRPRGYSRKRTPHQI